MDNPAIILLWVVGVAVGIGLAVLVLRRPSRAGSADVKPQSGLGARLASLGSSVKNALGAGLGDETWSALGETLLLADLGTETTDRVIDRVRSQRPATEADAARFLGDALLSELQTGSRELTLTGAPSVILVVGVNGTGKTTTIAKLGRWLMSRGKSVILGAADTFRAGAGNQLRVWGDRLATRVVVGAEGADPAAVAFDAVEAGRAAGVDAVIIDTAGRLHAKKNLMEELEKIHRVTAAENGVSEVLLVMDATAGQNGLAQVRQFAETVPVTGIVLTKLDGTAKGGIVVAVEKELGVPVKFVGIGERLDDLLPFDPNQFVDALLGDS